MPVWKSPSYSHYAKLREIRVGEPNETIHGVAPVEGNRLMALGCREDCMGMVTATLLELPGFVQVRKDEAGHPVLLATLYSDNNLASVMDGLAQRGIIDHVNYAKIKEAMGDLGKVLDWSASAQQWKGMDI